MTIIFVAGGTGGHIFPALEWMKDYPDSYLCTEEKGFQLLQRYKINVKNQLLFFNSTFFLKKWITIIKLIYKFWCYGASTVILFGSHKCLLPFYASQILRLPIYLYENNVMMGDSNLYFSYKAKIIFCQFPLMNYKDPKIFHLPIKNLSLQKNDQHQFFITLLGGSNGSLFLSNILPKIIQKVKIPKHVFIHHQCREIQEIPIIQDFYKKLYIHAHVSTHFYPMDEIYQKTDIMICRAGAGTITKIIQFQLPSIIVPYKLSKNNHQLENALFLNRWNACLLVEESNDLETFSSAFDNLLQPQIRIFLKNNLKKVYEYLNENHSRI